MPGQLHQKGKKSSALSTIIGLLPSLSSKELATVEAAIAQLRPKNIKAASSNEQCLYTAITSQTVPLNWGAFQKTVAYRDFQKYRPMVTKFICQTFTIRARVQFLALCNQLVSLVISDLNEKKLPASIGMVCSNLGRAPALFDAAFPDYRKSGLSDLILRAMERKAKE